MSEEFEELNFDDDVEETTEIKSKTPASSKTPGGKKVSVYFQSTVGPNQKQENHVEQDVPPEETKQLLNNILGQLKGMQRANMFDEFSIIRLMARAVAVSTVP